MRSNNGLSWPLGAKCALSLTYDDGLASQFKYAVPQLVQYGIKGTFFPSTWGLTNPENFRIWNQISSAGHEIGCHTLHHPCGNSFDFVKKGYSLQDYTLDRMEKEIMTNIELIREFGYKSKDLVFAYPCGQTALGARLETDYKPLIENMFIAARGTKRDYAVPGNILMNEVPCFGVEDDGQGLINIVKEAERTGTWAVILFHGVGGDYISVTAEAHAELLGYLKDNKDVWTAQFGKVAQYIKNINEG